MLATKIDDNFSPVIISTYILYPQIQLPMTCPCIPGSLRIKKVALVKRNLKRIRKRNGKRYISRYSRIEREREREREDGEIHR